MNEGFGKELHRKGWGQSVNGKEKDDDHDQDSLEKALRHMWSWSSENLSGL